MRSLHKTPILLSFSTMLSLSLCHPIIMLRRSTVHSLVFLFIVILFHRRPCEAAVPGFVQVSGNHFTVNGYPLYLNGFNAYWMMDIASSPDTKFKVTDTFVEASRQGMNIARTWAFTDGGAHPLQSSPGVYNEDMFVGLDFVVTEAKKNGVYLILDLVNNWDDLGGKKQYVEWARERQHSLSNDDQFFTDSVVIGYYKDHVKAVLTRVNSITGVAYKDDPTIFAWELMNEPTCESDLSGKSLQGWIAEMATHVKSIDNKHLLGIGHLGHYGESMKEKNPENLLVGADFIADHQIPGIDFATIHLYEDQWLPDSTPDVQFAFANSWVQNHFQDCNSVLKKPLLVGEFAKSSRSPGYNVSVRDNYFRWMYNNVYTSARGGGSGVGALFWQLIPQGLQNYGDGYEVVLAESPSTAKVIASQSQRLTTIH